MAVVAVMVRVVGRDASDGMQLSDHRLDKCPEIKLSVSTALRTIPINWSHSAEQLAYGHP